MIIQIHSLQSGSLVKNNVLTDWSIHSVHFKSFLCLIWELIFLCSCCYGKIFVFPFDKSCKITNCRSLPGKMSLLMITEKSSAFLLYIKRVNIVDIVKLYYSSFPTNAGRLHQQFNEYKLKCCSLIIICLHFTFSSLSGYLLLYTHPSIFCMWLF